MQVVAVVAVWVQVWQQRRLRCSSGRRLLQHRGHAGQCALARRVVSTAGGHGRHVNSVRLVKIRRRAVRFTGRETVGFRVFSDRMKTGKRKERTVTTRLGRSPLSNACRPRVRACVTRVSTVSARVLRNDVGGSKCVYARV